MSTNLRKKVPRTKKTFKDYSKNLNSKNFIITATTADKINDIINNIKSSKMLFLIVFPLKS